MKMMNDERGTMNLSGVTARRSDSACSSFIIHRSSFAFTLIELMIAVALMLLLMIGINLIFRMTGQAVSAGQALSENNRAALGGQNTFYRDMTNMAVEDGPCILLRSRVQPAFRNKQDMLGDLDYNPNDNG